MKIAFCFLTYDIIVRYDIWNDFFNNISDDKYIVFIHSKVSFTGLPVHGYGTPKNNSLSPHKYTFKYNIVKNKVITTSKDNINIVKATLRLFEETYNFDNSITHYIFLSQSCIPIYSFDILYNIITKFPNSVISSINYNKKERYHQLSNNIKKKIVYNNFVKQQPNMILIKDDVEKLIKFDYTSYFYNMTCPDEHYFINIIQYIFKNKIIKNQINFCNTDFTKTQALEFKNINKKLIDYIRQNGFLFMRKVNKNSIIEKDFLFYRSDVL